MARTTIAKGDLPSSCPYFFFFGGRVGSCSELKCQHRPDGLADKGGQKPVVGLGAGWTPLPPYSVALLVTSQRQKNSACNCCWQKVLKTEVCYQRIGAIRILKITNFCPPAWDILRHLKETSQGEAERKLDSVHQSTAQALGRRSSGTSIKDKPLGKTHPLLRFSGKLQTETTSLDV